MLPSVVANEVSAGVESYLRAAFPIGSPWFSTLWDDFFSRSDVLFKGPYYSVQLPFRQGGADYKFPSGMTLGFSPYLHQRKAFDRLCKGDGGSALIATGTGSGKTECFLFPLLDYCARRNREGIRGIKGIVVYPMNALATDQARRFAKTVADGEKYPELKDVRVGLYIGGQSDSAGTRQMSATEVITCKEELRANPPDVLLTNYKELDYLLVRERDYELWKENAPGVLRYVIVDELHTFDGAQGADLACLLRRVCARLGVAAEKTVRIGTSATLGSDPDSRDRLLQFARDVFGGEFDPDAIITEEYVEPEDAGTDAFGTEKALTDESFDVLDPRRYGTVERYLDEQAFFWLDREFNFEQGSNAEKNAERVRLGAAIGSSGVFRALFSALHGRTLDALALSGALAPILYKRERSAGRSRRVELDRLPRAFQNRVFESLFALVSHALREVASGDGKPVFAPYRRVRVQLWLREMARVAATFPDPLAADEEGAPERPALTFMSDESDDDSRARLPIVHCRACCRVGYLSFALPKSGRLSRNMTAIYRKYFGDGDVDLVYVPDKEDDDSGSRLFSDYLCPKCLRLASLNEPGACPKCGVPMLKVAIKKPGKGGASGKCPWCGEDELAIVGARSASLTSAALARMFGSKYNDDKKTLAFSDSVQDASHRAGFFVGRSFRHTFRAALQQFAAHFDRAPLLSDAVEEFAPYWLERFAEDERRRIEGFQEKLRNIKEDQEKKGQADPAKIEALERAISLFSVETRAQARFAISFLAPELQDWRYDFLRGGRDGASKLDDAEFRTRYEKYASELYELAAKRLRYETVAEYARLSQIGRTLERSGCSIAALRPDLRDAWIKRLAAWLREHIGGFRNAPDVENRAARFTVSFERLLRVSGGVWLAELKPLFEDDKTYSFGRKIDEYWYMPKLWKERMPRFVQTGRDFKYADSVARGKRPKRYDECARGTLGSESDGYRDEIYEKFLELGRELGILRRSESSKLGAKWGFSPDALVIETDVDRYVQEGTRRVFYAPKSESAIWDGAECYAWDACAVCRLDSKDADGEGEASRRFYESADVCRIVAREHTSLLDRADREALEKDFIAGSDANPAATNLLSCTPTLEMGVDIGDLSSVALCSVPPTRANFVQRVGRGGRRDGNSFNLVVAANRPRDLYYFNDPAEAFDGPIDPPGVFLNAPTVLERQLLAYAFDRWIQTELDAAKGGAAKRLVPMNLKTLFAARKNDVERAFPRNLFAFAERARDAIFDGFCALFGGVMRVETKEALRKFFIDGQSENGYQWKIEEKLERTAALRDGYAAKGAEVGKKLRELEKEVESDAIKLEKQNLRDERRALAKARDLIDKITTYEYFTDEGLLPNYAFPEEGMKLRTELWRRRNTKQDADEEEREPIAEEYSRAARAAISELAPGNNFYAGGRKLLVNRIDTAGQFEIERWRFCGDCGCVRKLSDSDTKGKCCPKCGSATWSGGNQTRNVVRLDRVVAEQEESETRAFDESDRRVPKLFSRKMLIEYVGNEPDVGFRLADESVPFGFEYWSKARFRDVNFGEPGDALAGDALRIAGEDVPAVGFRVCAECGMVTPPDKEPRHHVSCKYFRSDKSAQTPDCLYLYREFESEALRMPIPVVESYSASFVAAVRMALQEFFKGNVGHLRVAVQNESVDDSKVARRFLTVYDEVPGGTGYLKQFCELPNDLLEAFKLARDRLQKCACGRDSDKDGCYRCILAYANDKDVVNVSRSRALDALDAVLEYARDGEPFKKIVSVGALNYSSLVESELEEMFTQKFEEYAAANSGLNVAITKKLVHGTKGYLLTVGETSYEITRQKELGPANGVDVPSRADLYITPTRENTGALPIAVFTDGYEYHGNPSKDMYFRVVKDASQRSAIARSKSVPRLCWSLSYDDVAHAGAKPTFWAPLAPLECVKTKKSPAPEIWRIARLGAFEALLERLARPKLGGAKWQDLAFFAAISPEPGSAAGLDRFSFITESSAAGMWSALLEGLTYSKFASRASEVFSAGRDVGVFYKPLSPRVYCAVFYPNGKQHDELGGKRAAVVLDDSDAKSVDPEEFKFDWNTWLDAYNLLQFIPGAYMTTVSALREGSPLPLWDDAVFKSVAPSPDDAVWREAESEIDGLDGALEALGAARALGWEPPETWSDAEGRDGAALGSAPLLWRARRTLWTDDPSLREAAEREGWTFFTTEQN